MEKPLPLRELLGLLIHVIQEFREGRSPRSDRMALAECAVVSGAPRATVYGLSIAARSQNSSGDDFYALAQLDVARDSLAHAVHDCSALPPETLLTLARRG